MIKPGGGTGCARKVFRVRISGNLDGDISPAQRVARPVHFAPRPSAKRSQNLIRAQAIAGGQRHGGNYLPKYDWSNVTAALSRMASTLFCAISGATLSAISFFTSSIFLVSCLVT